MASSVKRSDRVLVEEEDDFAASTLQSRPRMRQDGRVECGVLAADVVRRDELGGRKDGADFGVECVKNRCGKVLGLSQL